MTNPAIQVRLRTFQRKWRIDPRAAQLFASEVWRALAGRKGIRLPGETEVSIVLMNNRRIRWYNAVFRRKDSPTDVLSFPVNDYMEERHHYLGDILISVEKAVAQAAKKGHTPDRELQILVLHGLLHLLGFDHETDAGEMDRMEGKIRRQVLNNRRWIRQAAAAR
jgi:probable rRNA maturation factor